jgi:hypothetical protein
MDSGGKLTLSEVAARTGGRDVHPDLKRPGDRPAVSPPKVGRYPALSPAWSDLAGVSESELRLLDGNR